jgi:hypothetical protein
MHELLPIAAGLCVGAAITLVRPSLRVPVGVAASVVIGVLATIVSGEFRISWDFLLIDIPGTGIAVVVGYMLTTRLRRPGAERVVGRRRP